MSNKHSESGFTLMEMLIVVTIIGILAAVVIPRFLTSSDSAKKAAHLAERQAINTQLQIYFFNHNEYPSSMTNAGWTSFENHFPDGVPVTCNQDIAWSIRNGQIDISTHSGHE